MTEPRFLFDSNIMIYLIAGSSTRLRARVEALMPGEAATSAICLAEMLYGLVDAPPRVLATLDKLLATIPSLPFDRDAARAFPSVPFRRGRSDRLIAAHALALNVTLVTNNPRDFADVLGLTVENWTLPA